MIDPGEPVGIGIPAGQQALIEQKLPAVLTGCRRKVGHRQVTPAIDVAVPLAVARQNKIKKSWAEAEVIDAARLSGRLRLRTRLQRRATTFGEALVSGHDFKAERRLLERDRKSVV